MKYFSLAILFLVSAYQPSLAEDDAYIPTALIVGADREIGFGFTQVHAARGWNVIATGVAPEKNTELTTLAATSDRIKIEQLNANDFKAVDALAERYRGQPVDLLLYATRLNVAEPPSNMEVQKFGQFDYDIFYLSLTTNAVAAIKVAEAFNEHVVSSRHKKIVQLSSMNGSIGKPKIRCQRCGNFFTESSFAAANALMRRLFKFHLSRGTGVVVGMIAPGAVNTKDMVPLIADNFPASSLVSVEDSVAGMVKIIDGLNETNSGSFYNYNGQELPW